MHIIWRGGIYGTRNDPSGVKSAVNRFECSVRIKAREAVLYVWAITARGVESRQPINIQHEARSAECCHSIDTIYTRTHG